MPILAHPLLDYIEFVFNRRLLAKSKQTSSLWSFGLKKCFYIVWKKTIYLSNRAAKIVPRIDDIFMDAFYISNMFRFISKGTNLIIVLDIIKLEKHPIYYLVSLLDKIYSRYKNSID